MTDSLQASARWYVYELVDPRTDSVFYVGKGTGKRLEQHEAEARKSVCSRKTRQIKDIWSAGCEVVRRKIALFWCEQSAYDAETDRIDEIGLTNLTNVMPGGQTAWVRRVTSRRVARAKKEANIQLIDMVCRSAASIGYWLVKMQAGQKPCYLEFTGSDRMNAVRTEISKIAWLQLLPDLWSRVIADRANWPRLVDAFRPYGVHLRFAGEQ